MKRIIVLLIVIVVSLIGVSIFKATHTVAPTVTPETPEQPSRVRAPEDVTVSKRSGPQDAAGVRITFNSFVADYRCGIDSNCDELGSIVVNVTLEAGDTKVTRNFPSDEVPFEFAGYAVSIVRVSPERMTGVDIAEEDYAITFHVEPLAGQGEISPVI